VHPPFVDSHGSPSQLPVPAPGRAAESREVAPTGLTLRSVLALVRRRWTLVLGVTVATSLLVSVLVLLEPPAYRSRAAIRLADPERPLALGMEQAAGGNERTINPVLVLVELLRSRTVLGEVVDSLSLRLQPLGARAGLRWLAAGSPLSPAGLFDLHLAPSARADTVLLTFHPDSASLRNSHGEAAAAYGQPMAVGGLQLTVRRRPAVPWALYEVVPREVAIDRVLKGLAVSPRKSTDIVDVAYTTTDPVLAQLMSNRVIAAFRASQERALRAQAQRSAEFLGGQRERIGDLLKTAQTELASFQSLRRAGRTPRGPDAKQTDLEALDVRIAELDADRRVYAALLQRLESGSDGDRTAALRELAYSPEIADDKVVQELYSQVLQYQVRLDSMSSGPHAAAPENPDRIQVASLVSSTREELVRALRARSSATAARRRALLAARANASAAARRLPALDAEEARLQHRVDILVTATDQLQLEYQKARLAEELAAGDVRIIDAAPLPYRPDGLPDAGKIALGLFLGLVLGTATAAGLDTMSRVIRHPEEVEKLLPVPRLGVIPPIEDDRSPDAHIRAMLGTARRSAAKPGVDQLPVVGAEAFRVVYSSLIPGWGEGERTILVTSTVPREGKTLTAANLAVIFAGEGARVLLVDCDVRRPRLHQVFRVASAPGLLQALADRPPPIQPQFSLAPGVDRGPPEEPPDPALQAIQPTTVPRLSVLAAGTRPGGHAELKGTEMRPLLARLASQFDVIILDTPPVLVNADAAILAPLADGVILVVRAGQTEREAVEQAYEQLMAAGGHVLGVVLNDPAGEIRKYDRYYYVYDETAEQAS
jgi:Mrp family chromosome partitioning ATPase/uncharacterized protein involved in exopolysaccharide biosynthesis